MPIGADTRFAHYHILALLGAGGMGEVYRARDTRLDREVAIKVLPASFANDADRLRRFQQEAQATSALNHPNILTVYDIGTHEGSPFIVAELLEGRELREELNEGPLSVRKAIEYAEQIATGLAAAHEKGIVHRDLKPENVFITRDGRVKILDFGLAKLRPQNLAGGADSQAPTLKPLTDPGVVMGTVGYMSPEQVRGAEVDHRSDIFSLGQILYEMLRGERAFERETMAETMTAILREDVPDFGEGNTKISPQVEKLVRRCLEKRPERRFQTASDLAFALESVTTSSSSGSAVTLASSDRQSAAAPEISYLHAWLRRWGWASVAGIATLALIVVGIAYLRRSTQRVEAVRLFVTAPEKATHIGYPSLSPDGRVLAFLAMTGETTRVWVRPMNATTAKPLAETEGAQWAFWSADSQYVGFYSGGKLRRVAPSGGTPVVIAESEALLPGSTWNADGVILFGVGRSGIKRASASGAGTASVTTVDFQHGEVGHAAPFFLPDGSHFVFHVQHSDAARQGIYLGSLDGGQARQLVTTDMRSSWAGEDPDTPGKGYLVFLRQGVLLAQAFDFSRLAVSGEPVRLIDEVYTNLLGQRGANGQFSIAGNVLAATEGLTRQQLIWVDRAGRKTGTIGTVGGYGVQDISPDDQQIAATRYDPKTGNGDIWLISIASGRETRFTVDPGNDTFPRWSPDSSRIAWASNRNGLHGIYVRSANGAGSDELLYESANAKVPMEWTPDGRFILYREVDSQTLLDLWMLPLEGDRKPFPWLKTQFTESVGKGISPDGKWLAYSSDETGRSQFYLQALVPGAPASGAKWLISTNSGSMPRWRRDGRGLYYYDATLGKLMEVDVRVGAKVEAGTPRELISLGPIQADMTRAWALTRDDQRFLFVSSAEGSTVPPITVVLNWMEEIKQRKRTE